MLSEILPGKQQRGPAEAHWPQHGARGTTAPPAHLAVGPGKVPRPGPATGLPRGEGVAEPLMLSTDSSPQAGDLQATVESDCAPHSQAPHKWQRLNFKRSFPNWQPCDQVPPWVLPNVNCYTSAVCNPRLGINYRQDWPTRRGVSQPGTAVHQAWRSRKLGSRDSSSTGQSQLRASAAAQGRPDLGWARPTTLTRLPSSSLCPLPSSGSAVARQVL